MLVVLVVVLAAGLVMALIGGSGQPLTARQSSSLWVVVLAALTLATFSALD